MEGQETGPKITIKAAADLLEVTTKTIQRYLASGRLTRLKEGTRTFLLLAEVDSLRGAPELRQGQPDSSSVRTPAKGQPGDTVTLTRERYEQLLIELGELRKQNQFFLEGEGTLPAKDEVLRRLAEDLEELQSRVQALEMGREQENGSGSSEAPREPSAKREKAPARSKKPWWQA